MACETPHLMLPYFQIWMTFHFKYIMQFPKQLQRTVCSPGSFSPTKATNAVHFKRHQGFRLTVSSQLSALEEFWKQVKSYFPGTFPPSSLPSLINNTLDVFRFASQKCLWLCHQNTKASLISCFHLHFHPVFRPSACDSTFNQTNFALLLWCCESRESQVAADKCSVACHFS